MQENRFPVLGESRRNAPAAGKSFFAPESKFDLFGVLFGVWLGERGADKADTISGTTHDELRAVMVSAAANEAVAVNQVVRSMLQQRGSTPVRARMIARTETHNAAMFASQESMKRMARDVEVEIFKKWIPALDERTRVAHAAMVHHKVIPMDGLFTVGGEKMQRPGDPAGSAGNVINCRCIMVYPSDQEGGFL